MFQYGVPRKHADDAHICVKCLIRETCEVREDTEAWMGWRTVLAWCAKYQGLEVVSE